MQKTQAPPEPKQKPPVLDLRCVSSQSDLGRVVSLCRDFRGWLCERYPEHDWANDPFYSPERWEDLMAQLPALHKRPDGLILLASLDDKAAGCVMLQRLEADICEMKRLFVHPDCRGYGVGRHLCQRLISEAADLGYKTLRLDTGSRHTEAQALYGTLGFRQIEPYYECPPELREIMLFMELDLTTPSTGN